MMPVGIVQLRPKIAQTFNLTELRDLCFRLQIDHQTLTAPNKTEFLIELLSLIGRTDRLPDLLAVLAEMRPDIAWATPSPATAPLKFDPDILSARGDIPAGSRFFYRANPVFTGREPELMALARTLQQGQAALIGEAVSAVTGLGGVGKSQLAVEFVHRYGRYQPIHFTEAIGILE